MEDVKALMSHCFGKKKVSSEFKRFVCENMSQASLLNNYRFYSSKIEQSWRDVHFITEIKCLMSDQSVMQHVKWVVGLSQ